MSTKTRTAKAKLAAASRHHPEQDHENLRRELKAAGLEDHVRKAVESYPPLTPEQLQIISAALHPPTSGTEVLAGLRRTRSGGDAA